MAPPTTRRAFGLEVAYAMCDKIKVTTGCGICDELGKTAEELEWYDLEGQEMVTSDAVILAPYHTAMKQYAVVCLDCVQSIRNVFIPKLKEKPSGNKSSKRKRTRRPPRPSGESV